MVDLKVISIKEYVKMKKEKQSRIFYGFHESPFGKYLIGVLNDRICHLSFVNTVDSANLNFLKSQWPGSILINNEKFTKEISKNIFCNETEVFKVILKGTPFQAKVWQELLKIPRGKTMSYEGVATAAGNEKAVRAAANAVAKNFVSYLVPCHRVIKKDGSLHKYQWGSVIKEKILQFENCSF